MAATILLDPATWDLVLDANGNVALATEPYALAQDAASAIKTFLGECWWDTTVGVDWDGQILGESPSLPILKAALTAAALTVPGVAQAKVFVTSLDQRAVQGQVQVMSQTTGVAVAAAFAAINPQVA